MAAIQKRGKKYRVRVIRRGFPTQSKTFITHAEALRWSRDIEIQMDRGEFKSHEAERSRMVDKSIPFQQAAHHYQKTHSIHKKIVRCETSRLNILIKRWGDLEVGKVDKQSVITLRDDLLKMGRSGETINHYFNTISKLFQMLKDEWDIDIANPIKGIKRMPPSQGRTKRVNVELECLLLSGCDQLSLPLLRSIIQFAIYTGMRRGELMRLTWADIDLPNRKAYLHQTKNGEPRQVPLTRQAIAVLEALSKDEERVFPMGMDALRSQFGHLKEYAKGRWNGIGVNPFYDLRFHDLRHEALSRLSDAGLNVIELSHISGHRTLGMLKRYTHPSHEAIFLKLERE
ncbi:site-specific integrase [Polynucleobacter paludilacus]|uniref:site-specific integrase n=1 Tax=Polynucleobacter paludilacus TaxID=1855895 RepID=UPI001BFD3328|nr:site-specific integrase [Polynucleobacter paludilacus]QWD86374.1 site-specific integrase [Polynucleobacter paludilacus]